MEARCKICGWDLSSALAGMDGPIFSTPALADQAAIAYTIFTAHMQIHILDALVDIEAAIQSLGKEA